MVIKSTSSLLIAFILSACVTPGEGEIAEAAFLEYQPVIDGLAQYYEDRGEYPDDLVDLTPEYFSCAPPSLGYEDRSETKCDKAPKHDERCYGDETTQISRYTLKTGYYENGWIACTFSSVEKDWQCWRE